VALIISSWEVRDGGVDELEASFEGEEPLNKLIFFEKHFNPYKHLNIKEFMVNLGSYLSELIRVFTLDGIGEFAVLMDFLTQNVNGIHYAGSVVNKIEEAKKLKKDKSNDFD
jgi:hypothetical protein